MVACDHAHLNTCALALGDGLLRLGPRRVDHAHQSQQGEVLHQREQVGVGIKGLGIELSLGQHQDPQALAGHIVVGFHDTFM